MKVVTEKSYINVESLFQFHFHFRLGVLVGSLAGHVDVDVDRDLREELHRGHGTSHAGELHLNLVTLPQGRHVQLEGHDALHFLRLEGDFLSSHQLEIDFQKN